VDADDKQTPAPVPVTREIALGHASRLLHAAETITDQALMARYESMADSWLAMAALLSRDSE
jgi:hypothetical protein